MEVISRTVSRPCCWLRSTTATLPPSRANRRAIALPMPDPAPVTRHDLFANRMAILAADPCGRPHAPPHRPRSYIGSSLPGSVAERQADVCAEHALTPLFRVEIQRARLEQIRQRNHP